MAYEKLKEEMYLNVGGINEKAMDTATGEKDVLDLSNLSFERPGGWVSRPGYSLYVNSSLTAKVSGIFEYERLTGESYLLVSAGSTMLSYTGTTPTVVRTDMGSGPIDFLTFVGLAWSTDGAIFSRFNGSISSKWYLPPFIPGGLASSSATFDTGIVSSTGVTACTYGLDFAYANEFSEVGPVIIESESSNHLVKVIATPGTGAWQVWGFTIPPGYGISKMAVWVSSGQATVEPGENKVLSPTLYPFSLTTIGGVTTYFMQFYPYTDTGEYQVRSEYLGSSLAGIGVSYYFTQSATLLQSKFMEAPKYMALYNNFMVYGGFSLYPSVNRFSEIGSPNLVKPDNFIETRTNDGDKITGYAVFQGNALVFKERSISALNGISPDDLSQQEITTNYGCINNRTILQFENRLFFMDTEGVCEFNGVNTTVVSTKLEQTLKRMNLSVARDTACAVYIKDRNEAWFAIPLDSSTVNNCIVVYDHTVDAWTLYEGFSPYSMFVGKGALSANDVLWGNHTGIVYAFGESLTSDNGATITTVMQTKFHKRMGDSTTEMWRRFYLNSSTASVTTAATVDFIPNYGTSSSLQSTMYLDQFQNRIELGLPAKAMSVKVTIGSTSDRIKIMGYTIESRYLRGV